MLKVLGWMLKAVMAAAFVVAVLGVLLVVANNNPEMMAWVEQLQVKVPAATVREPATIGTMPAIFTRQNGGLGSFRIEEIPSPAIQATEAQSAAAWVKPDPNLKMPAEKVYAEIVRSARLP